jgi:hypothetical protein
VREEAGNVKVLKFKSLKELDELPGWLTFGDAALDLGVSGERIRQMAQEGKLHTAKRIGRRPVGIVKESEVAELVRQKKERKEREDGHREAAGDVL